MVADEKCAFARALHQLRILVGGCNLFTVGTANKNALIQRCDSMSAWSPDERRLGVNTSL